MKQLLRFEFRKLFRQKSFYICAAVAAAMVVIIALSTNLLLSLASREESLQNVPASVLSPTAWSFAASAFSNGQFSLILGIFVALYACADNTNDTLKNIYARGYGRTPVYLAKFVVSAAGSLLTFAAITLLSFVVGALFLELGDPAGYARTIPAQAVVMLGYHTMFYMIAVMIARTGGAIAVNIVGPSVVSLLLTLGDNLLQSDTFRFSDYWIDRFYLVAQDPAKDWNALLGAMAGALVFAAVFFTAGLLLNRRKQL